MIISGIIKVIYSLALITMGCLYLNKRYELYAEGSISSVLQSHTKLTLFTISMMLIVTGMEFFYLAKNGVIVLPAILKWTTIVWGSYLLAIIDYKEKKIPNQIILALLGIRMLILLYEVMAVSEYRITAVLNAALGALIGGLIIAIAMAISRGGVGMGDVKLFIAIGAFVGSTEIIATMFYTFLISAIIGLGLLVTQKKGLKDSVPMAPFVFVGLMVEYMLLMIGR